MGGDLLGPSCILAFSRFQISKSSLVAEILSQAELAVAVVFQKSHYSTKFEMERVLSEYGVAERREVRIICYVTKKSIPIRCAILCQSQLLSSLASINLHTSSRTSSAVSVFLHSI